MMSDTLVNREGLLGFISPNPQPIRVLAIESLFYLKELRALLPSAQISVVTAFEPAAESDECANLGIEWYFLDFRRDDLPFSDGSFDIILAEPCLTAAFTPYETLAVLGKLLKDTGFMVTQFRNIRYWRILQDLREGFFHEREERLYAKPEVVRLLNDAIFKEISFAPLREEEGAGPAEWETMGFADFSNDLGTEIWMVMAARSTAAVANLKSLYTPEIRRELSWILHRIEYDIDRQENFDRLWRLCEKHMIFEDYLWDFAREVIIHSEALEVLSKAAEERGMEVPCD